MEQISKNNRPVVMLVNVIVSLVSLSFVIYLLTTGTTTTTTTPTIPNDTTTTTTDGQLTVTPRILRRVTPRAKTILPPSKKKPFIPHTFIFTYSHNIIETGEPPILDKNIRHTIQQYSQAWNDDDDNKPQIMFYTDEECRRVLLKVYPEIVEFFDNEPRGAFKADICRIAALFDHGGYYFDVDILVVKPILLPRTTSFATVMAPLEEDFFQAFIAAEAGHPILRKALRFMELHYRGIMKAKVDLLGPKTLKWAFDCLDPKERRGSGGGVVILNEIWLTVPFWRRKYPRFPQQKGYGCCCNYVVHDPKEEEIYFYSRIIDYSKNRCSSTPLQ